MIGISIANSLGLKLSGINPDAAAFIAAAGITGTTQVDAVNALVNGLQADGLWSKMKAVYPFVTDNKNLLEYTEDFSNAAWLKLNTTVTTNSTTAPNGTLTADTITHTNTSADIWQLFNGGAGIYTYTIYAKYNNVQWVRPFIGASGNAVVVWFDIQNGVVGSNGGVGSSTLISKSIDSVGNGWYRLNITVNLTATSGNYFQINTAQADGNSTRQIGSFYVWGAQLELGSTATTYQPIATTQQAYIASQFKYNLKDPRDLDAAFRLVFNGGWTHSSTGATPNGTNGYADTKLVPSSVLSLNSTSHSVYSRSLSPIGMMGGVNDTNYLILNNPTSTTIASQLNSISTNLITGNIVNSQGLLMANRVDSLNINIWRNSTKVASDSKASTGLPALAYFISGRNSGGASANYDSKQYAFYHLGDGLTDTEATNLYTRVQAFQTALSRQV